MTTGRRIKSALVSVYDKQGLTEFATTLSSLGVAIIATGKTYLQLRNEGIAATELSDYTSFPEIMDGRVKSLHPKIYGGILARRDQDQDILKQHDIQAIDLVVCNLYPFQETISQPNCTQQQAIEQIDIGGPTMIRAAAKNHQDVTVVVDPSDYDDLIEELKQHGNTTSATRQRLALKAFQMTSQYDTAIAHYFATQQTTDNNELPSTLNIQAQQKNSLRYGENPHQSAASFVAHSSQEHGVLQAELIQGKPLSYNNLIDSDATFNLIRSLATTQPACVIVKHTTPCGVALHDNIIKAYDHAFACDPQSAFGGIIGINQPLDDALAQHILQQQFVEVILAPSVTEQAANILGTKPNVRVLAFGNSHTTPPMTTKIRSLSGGFIAQQPDWHPLTIDDLTCVTQRKMTPQQLQDCLFAWNVVKHVKSNAIVYAKDGRTLGIGCGQTSRVFSAQIAALRAEQAKLSLQDCIMASDAFFPFADSIDLAHEYGISCIIQPGGSKRDPEVIARADELNIAMAFTSIRHFLH